MVIQLKKPSLSRLALTVLVILAGIFGSEYVNAQTTAQGKNFYRYRNSFYKMRYGKSTRQYRRACRTMERKQRARQGGFFARAFRRKDFSNNLRADQAEQP